jgi:hypothetical protein
LLGGYQDSDHDARVLVKALPPVLLADQGGCPSGEGQQHPHYARPTIQGRSRGVPGGLWVVLLPGASDRGLTVEEGSYQRQGGAPVLVCVGALTVRVGRCLCWERLPLALLAAVSHRDLHLARRCARVGACQRGVSDSHLLRTVQAVSRSRCRRTWTWDRPTLSDATRRMGLARRLPGPGPRRARAGEGPSALPAGRPRWVSQRGRATASTFSQTDHTGEK